MRIYAKAVVIAAKDIPDNLTEEQIAEQKDTLRSELNLDMDCLHREEDGGFPYEWEHDTDDYEPSGAGGYTDEMILSYLNAKMDEE